MGQLGLLDRACMDRPSGGGGFPSKLSETASRSAPLKLTRATGIYDDGPCRLVPKIRARLRLDGTSTIGMGGEGAGGGEGVPPSAQEVGCPSSPTRQMHAEHWSQRRTRKTD